MLYIGCVHSNAALQANVTMVAPFLTAGTMQPGYQHWQSTRSPLCSAASLPDNNPSACKPASPAAALMFQSYSLLHTPVHPPSHLFPRPSPPLTPPLSALPTLFTTLPYPNALPHSLQPNHLFAHPSHTLSNPCSSPPPPRPALPSPPSQPPLLSPRSQSSTPLPPLQSSPDGVRCIFCNSVCMRPCFGPAWPNGQGGAGFVKQGNICVPATKANTPTMGCALLAQQARSVHRGFQERSLIYSSCVHAVCGCPHVHTATCCTWYLLRLLSASPADVRSCQAAGCDAL